MASNRRQLAIILIFTLGVMLAQVIPIEFLLIGIGAMILYWFGNSDIKRYERKAERRNKYELYNR